MKKPQNRFASISLINLIAQLNLISPVEFNSVTEYEDYKEELEIAIFNKEQEL